MFLFFKSGPNLTCLKIFISANLRQKILMSKVSVTERWRGKFSVKAEKCSVNAGNWTCDLCLRRRALLRRHRRCESVNCTTEQIHFWNVFVGSNPVSYFEGNVLPMMIIPGSVRNFKTFALQSSCFFRSNGSYPVGRSTERPPKLVKESKRSQLSLVFIEIEHLPRALLFIRKQLNCYIIQEWLNKFNIAHVELRSIILKDFLGSLKYPT